MTPRYEAQVFVFILISAVPAVAEAYVGPGAGLGAIGTVIALLGAILLGIVGFIWYPVKRLLRGRKKPAAEESAETADQAQQREPETSETQA